MKEKEKEKVQQEKVKNKAINEFEFCKVCKINHNQGRRHNFFPRHKNSLSSFLSRFLKKITDVRSYLKNPTFHLQQSSSRYPLWCVFCDYEIDELANSFARGNAIMHFASEEHLKSLKHFMWKYGGGMDRIDSFRITEADLAKWEKRCGALKREAEKSSGGSSGPFHVQLNNIQSNYGLINNFRNNDDIILLSSNLSNHVMPLQCNTNESYQVSHSDKSQAANLSCCAPASTSSLSILQSDSNAWNSKDITDYKGNELSYHPGNGSHSSNSSNMDPQIYGSEWMNNLQSKPPGFQKLTQIHSLDAEVVKDNVHTGAPPPWLEAADVDKMMDCHLNGADTSLPPPIKKSRKTDKLNPKRVGAAWAERRKMELEREKRGETVAYNWDAEWLPNFGGVWQSGSRKESRKEFVKEEQQLPVTECQSVDQRRIQPYISKRMRRKANDDSSEDHFTQEEDEV